MFLTDRYEVTASGPPWFSALAGRLEGGNLAFRVTLGPAAAVNELLDVLPDAGTTGDVWVTNFPSLYDDVDAALEQLGPSLRAFASDALVALTSAIDRARREHRRGSSPRRGWKMRAAAAAAVVKVAARAVADRFADRTAFLCAWDDLLDSFRDVDADAMEGVHRTLVFRDLAAVAGVGWQTFGGTTDYIAAVLLGRLDGRLRTQACRPLPPRTLDVAPSVTTPLDEARLAECRQRLLAPPGFADVAVWFVIARAHLDDRDEPSEGGGLDLLTGRDVERQFSSTASDDATPGYPEFRSAAGTVRLMFEEALQAPDVVLARLWMPGTNVEQAAAYGRYVLEGLLIATGDGQNWQLQRSSALWSAKTGWHPSRLSLDSKAFGADHPAFSTTGRQLTTFEPSVVRELIAGDAQARGVLDDVRWAVEAQRSGTAAQRLLLSIRVLERAAKKVGGTTWSTTAEAYLCGAWVEHELVRWLRAAVTNVDFALGKTRDWRRAVVAEQYEEQRATVGDEFVIARMDEAADKVPQASTVTDWLWDGPGHGEATTRVGRARRLGELLTHVGDAETALAAGLVETRNVREAVGLLDSRSSALRWLRRKDDEFAALLARTERARNGIVHGHPATPDVYATVDSFVTDLSRLVARDAFAGLTTGKVSMEGLKAAQERHEQRKEELGTNPRADVAAVLFDDVWTRDVPSKDPDSAE